MADNSKKPGNQQNSGKGGNTGSNQSNLNKGGNQQSGSNRGLGQDENLKRTTGKNSGNLSRQEDIDEEETGSNRSGRSSNLNKDLNKGGNKR